MALVFQVAMIVIAFARDRWGTAGIYSTAAVLGLTDVDALTMTMARLDGGLNVEMAARAIAIGIISNTVLKLVMGVSLGAPAFRKVLASGLLLLGAALTLTLAVG
jgi:uncharacterized membrane protein (DUF4010 family)